MPSFSLASLVSPWDGSKTNHETLIEDEFSPLSVLKHANQLAVHPFKT